MSVYARAFGIDRGRCFRYVYEQETTRPVRCPGEVAGSGWWEDRSGAWWEVDACGEHAGWLRPGSPPPGARRGTATVAAKAPRRRSMPTASPGSDRWRPKPPIRGWGGEVRRAA